MKENQHVNRASHKSPSKNESESQKVSKLIIGMDVGSTTVKAVVIDPETKKILWQDYERHETKQPELVRDYLNKITASFSSVPRKNWRIFITGSGGGTVSPLIGSKFVHEVNAVTLAMEERHPDAGSVIELGGQDAKVIIWKIDPVTGNKQVFTSMNDKCAGGTGATIDKIVTKVGMKNEELIKIPFDESKLHHIAGKCGVFAETDVVNLLKAGVPSDEIMCSLADAIIKQNLSVLTRGNVLRDTVYLLGGPNTYLPFLKEAWKKRIPEIWKERKWKISKDVSPEDLIVVPENAQYYAAYGSALFGINESASIGVYKGIDELVDYIENGRKDKLLSDGASKGLVKDRQEYKDFSDEYSIAPFQQAVYEKGSTVKAVIGVDGGSTSTKGVLMDMDGKLMAKAYQLSNGNPIQDTKEILAQLRDQVHSQGAHLEVMGFGTTGYAADVLEEAMLADVNLVETVAHMRSATHFYGEVDVIIDVGGQDIKVLFMENERIKDFKLNTQCSAGNGYFLQGMAQQFGIDIKDYANYAFEAEIAPIFNYGCAVFMEQDKVNFQQQGWQKEEMMAGLALVLPLNIWQYVVQEPNLKKYGKRFVLQGGTQYNLAAVKSQVDYIKEKVPGAVVKVHQHAGESGAIGTALEVIRVVQEKGESSFVGLDDAIGITYTTTTSEDTRCYFCSNHCSRTFIDTSTPTGLTARYISGFSCEKGTVENEDALKTLNKKTKELKNLYPNLVDYAAKLAFRDFKPQVVPENHQIEEEKEVRSLFKKKEVTITRPIERASDEWIKKRKDIRIGIPKALNLYSTAPFWKTYLQAIGIPKANVIFSDFTNDELWSQGSKWGSIDPCFPSKAANAHVHNLIFQKSNEKRPIDIIFFPIVTHLQTQLKNTVDNASCPISAGAPEVIKAAFTREKDVFKEHNMTYFAPNFKMDEENLFKDQLHQSFKGLLGVTKDENDWAFQEASKALKDFDRLQKEKGKAIIEELKVNNKVGVVMLGRPYHNDPGLNHDILESIQVMGFPVLSMQSLPQDKEFLDEIFGNDLQEGFITDSMDITDVWKNCYSENSSFKIWAAKVAARHPNLVVVDLSNFKCGHDSPIYNLIENIMATSNTPYFTFHDIDENKPAGSIKIRTKTIKYFLERYEAGLAGHQFKLAELEERMDKKREELHDLYRVSGDFNVQFIPHPVSAEANEKETIPVS